MSSDYDDSNRGAIWPIDRKKSDRHPDYTGRGNVDGVEYYISAWATDGSNPKAPSLRFSFTPKEEVANTGLSNARAGLAVQPVGGQAVPPASTPPDFDDDLPF